VTPVTPGVTALTTTPCAARRGITKLHGECHAVQAAACSSAAPFFRRGVPSCVRQRGLRLLSARGHRTRRRSALVPVAVIECPRGLAGVPYSAYAARETEESP
jgi:hypothetical protein